MTTSVIALESLGGVPTRPNQTVPPLMGAVHVRKGLSSIVSEQFGQQGAAFAVYVHVLVQSARDGRRAPSVD